MRYSVLIGVAVSALLVGCSQSGTHVPFYKYGAKDVGGSLGIHTLRQGETLWTVANAYHVDLRDMLDINKMSAPYKIKAGQRIRIPAPLSYKVRSGDTLYNVSRMFDTTTTELARLNNLRAPYKLNRNQSLRLPPRHKENTRAYEVASKNYDVPPTKSQTKVARVESEVLASNLPASHNNSAKNNQVNKAPQNNSQPPVSTEWMGGKVSFIKPVSGKIISGYGPKPDGLHNDGVNIKAAKGDAIRAAEQGIVVYSGSQIEGYGNMVLIRHANGYLTAYAHMQKSLVKKGDRVKRGQTIGTVGATGNVKTPQLHFEIRKGKEAINPQTLMAI